MTRERFDGRAIWTSVQLNLRVRTACRQHRFPPLAECRSGERMTCEVCGGWMNLGQAISYVEGFRAAGGDPEAVWPGFFARAEPVAS